jgi:hypothetical protein
MKGDVNNSQALGALGSFLSQEYFFAYKALSLRGEENKYISMEKIGDLGIETSGPITNNEIDELKNSMSKDSPVTDMAVDLWKTIYNWCNYFYCNELGEHVGNYQLILCVWSMESKSAEMVNKMHNCKSEEVFKKEILSFVKDNLGMGRTRHKSLATIKKQLSGKNKKAKDYMQLLMTKEYFSLFEKVICQMEYENIIGDVSGLIESKLERWRDFKPGELEESCKYYVGAIKQEVMKCIENSECPVISAEFINDLFKRHFMDDDRRYARSLFKPSEEEIRAERVRENTPLYIKQLTIIGYEEEYAQKAIIKYLVMNNERKRWVENGYVLSKDDKLISKLQEEIIECWKYKCSDAALHFENEIKRGCDVFLKMMQNQFKMDTIDLDKEIAGGFVHELAGLTVDDDKSIGWHPNYKKLLKGA